MGNVLFRCCSTRQAGRFSNRRRPGLWEKLLSTCGVEASPKRSRRSNDEKASIEGPNSEWFSENRCGTESRDSMRQRRSVKHTSRSRSTSRASIPLPKEDPQESLLRPIKEGWDANTSSAETPGRSSPEAARSVFNQHCYKQLQGNSSMSHSSPPSGGSQDMTRTSSSQQHYGQPPVNSAPSYGSHSLSHSSRDLTINQHSSQQRHVGSESCSSVPRSITDCSPDTRRRFFNQHCYQQVHKVYPVPLKKCRSPRRYPKPGSGKSRRKRTGMRSPSHRTSTSRSPARNNSGRIEDNEDKRNGVTAPSRKTPSFRSLGKVLKENEDKSSETRVQPDRTSRRKTLARAFKECIEENDDNSIGTRSQSHKMPYSKSPGRPINRRIHDYEQSSSSQYILFNGSQAGMVSPISRRAALALIGRQKAFGSRRNSMRSCELSGRNWRPALESISESF